MKVRAMSPVRLSVLLFATLAVIVVGKTLAIEVLFQYNTHHLIMPTRVHPRPQRQQPVPLRIFRVANNSPANDV